MIVKLQEIWQDIDTLPEDVQILILDFIRLLKKCYSSTELENNKGWPPNFVDKTWGSCANSPIIIDEAGVSAELDDKLEGMFNF